MSGKPELAGQTVVVIGGSSGLGFETSAIVTTNQVVEALASVETLGISARSFYATGRNLNA